MLIILFKENKIEAISNQVFNKLNLTINEIPNLEKIFKENKKFLNWKNIKLKIQKENLLEFGGYKIYYLEIISNEKHLEKKEETPELNLNPEEVKKETPELNLNPEEVKEETPELNLNPEEVKEETPELNLNLEEVKEEKPELNLNLEEAKEEKPELNLNLEEVKEKIPELNLNLEEVKKETPELNLNLEEVKEETPELNLNPEEVKEEKTELNLNLEEVKEKIPELNLNLEEVKKETPELNLNLEEVKENTKSDEYEFSFTIDIDYEERKEKKLEQLQTKQENPKRIKVSFTDEEELEILNYDKEKIREIINQNLEQATSEMGIEKVMLQEMFVELLKQIKMEKKNFYIYIQNINYEEIHKLAHKLKGASLNLRIESFATVLKYIDELSKNKKDINKIKDYIDKFYQLLEKIEER